MEEGYLKVHTFIADNLAPVAGAKVIIHCECGKMAGELHTDENGMSETLTLPASNDFDNLKRYNVTVSHGGKFREVKVHGVTIFAGITSTLPVQMHPRSSADEMAEEISIPHERGVDLRETKSSKAMALFIAASMFRRW